LDIRNIYGLDAQFQFGSKVTTTKNMSNKIQKLLKKLGRFGYKATQKSQATDIVCNMEVQEGLISSEYKGKLYSFCSEHCKKQFDANPIDFVS
jgi:YHS domain-containing protein